MVTDELGVGRGQYLVDGCKKAVELALLHKAGRTQASDPQGSVEFPFETHSA